MSTPRRRSNENLRDNTYTYYSQAGVPTVYTASSLVGKKEEMWDFVTPDFHKKSSKGLILMNPMGRKADESSIATIQDYSVCTQGDPRLAYTVGHDHNAVQVVVRPSYNGNSIITAQRQSQLNVETATRCQSQIRRTSVDNWENIAEAGKTIEMLKKPVSSWLTWNSKFRAISAGLSAANAWLAYRYGVRPLISSIEGTLKEMRRNVKPVRTTTRTSNKDEDRSVVEGGYDSGGHHARWRTTQVESYAVRCMSIDEVTLDMWEQGGLSAKSLLTLPWELIPYSFVADWVFNVGDYIGALAQGLFPSSLGQCETHVWNYSYDRTMYSAWVDLPLIGAPGLYRFQYSAVLKQRYTALTSPGLVIKSDFKLDSATRLADSFALIGQQILRRFT